ncbi:MAG: M20/M25/M40 family metallo-hydrolase [Ignavibacteriales bacterium]|nr:M20/M25/M40 family metallo-hydrolase [Ignavibacteriales bacterium]
MGQGAHDDGAGVIHVIEAMRLLRGLPAPPRTIRAVLFANEEFGLDGGKAYAAAHGSEPHLAAIESDMGGFRPHHRGVAATEAQIAWLRPWPSPVACRCGSVAAVPTSRPSTCTTCRASVWSATWTITSTSTTPAPTPSTRWTRTSCARASRPSPPSPGSWRPPYPPPRDPALTLQGRG